MAAGRGNLHGTKAFLLLCISSLPFTVISLTKCVKIDSCRASTDRGEIDLGPLTGTGGNPRFKILDSAVGSTDHYSWNPCKPWTDTSPGTINTCQNVAVCYYTTLIGVVSRYGIGKPNTASFKLDKTGQCVLTYTGMVYGFASTTVNIALKCSDDEGKVDSVVQDSTSNAFSTTLHSRYACPSKEPTISVGLSTGSILVIVFCCVILIYIVAGILFGNFSRGATGKELCPNYSFWAELPALIAAGWVFVFEKCKSLCSGVGHKASYESI